MSTRNNYLKTLFYDILQKDKQFFLHKFGEGQGITINSRPSKFHLLIRLCYVEACILH